MSLPIKPEQLIVWKNEVIFPILAMEWSEKEEE